MQGNPSAVVPRCILACGSWIFLWLYPKTFLRDIESAPLPAPIMRFFHLQEMAAGGLMMENTEKSIRFLCAPIETYFTLNNSGNLHIKRVIKLWISARRESDFALNRSWGELSGLTLCDAHAVLLKREKKSQRQARDTFLTMGGRSQLRFEQWQLLTQGRRPSRGGVCRLFRLIEKRGFSGK